MSSVGSDSVNYGLGVCHGILGSGPRARGQRARWVFPGCSWGGEEGVFWQNSLHLGQGRPVVRAVTP